MILIHHSCESCLSFYLYVQHICWWTGEGVSSSNFASLHWKQGQITFEQLFYSRDKNEDISECLQLSVVDDFISGQQQQQQ